MCKRCKSHFVVLMLVLALLPVYCHAEAKPFWDGEHSTVVSPFDGIIYYLFTHEIDGYRITPNPGIAILNLVVIENPADRYAILQLSLIAGTDGPIECDSVVLTIKDNDRKDLDIKLNISESGPYTMRYSQKPLGDKYQISADINLIGTNIDDQLSLTNLKAIVSADNILVDTNGFKDTLLDSGLLKAAITKYLELTED